MVDLLDIRHKLTVHETEVGRKSVSMTEIPALYKPVHWFEEQTKIEN